MADVDTARLAALAQSFSPSAPIDQKSLFAGRINQLMTVLTAVNQKGQHAILFGERGVGKTSLARVITQMASAQHVSVASVNCESTMTYSVLWHKIAREILMPRVQQPLGFTAQPSVTATSLDAVLPEKVTPDDIRFFFSRLGKALVVIDEFDRLTDPEVTTLVSDTIKTLSDHAVDVTLLLVGVADSVESLIAEHQSIERAMVQVRMPRMSKPELFEIIDKGLRPPAMTIETAAKEQIAGLSQGLPHYTHLLSLAAAQRTVMRGAVEVATTDVRSAIDNAIANAQQSIVAAYHKATASPRENLYRQVLLACALANQDTLGYFASVDVRGPLSDIMGKAYDIPAFSQHLNAFCEDSRGPILQRTGSARRFRFRFVNPLMQPYVIMDGIKAGLITDGAVTRT